MIESWFIEEASSQEGRGMDFSSVIEGVANESEWTIGFVFRDRGSCPLSLIVSYITIWD